MALYSKENIAHGTFMGVWKKEEPLELLESVYLLNTHEEKEYQKISNETRKKEWLTTRILLTELLEKRSTILYTEHRKPFIENQKTNISISHSQNFVALIISSDYYPGIDVETISKRVEKVKHKFLSDDELEWCLTLEQLTACWSAKEAVFKIYEKELNFHDMVISPFDIEANTGKIKLKVIKSTKEAQYVLTFCSIENDILTYTLSKSAID